MAKSFSRPRITPVRGGLRLSDANRRNALIRYYHYGNAGGGPTYSAEYQAVLNSGIGTPPASEAGKQADDLLIQKAKEIGLWDASPCFFNHMTEGDAAYACIDYKNPGVRTAELINSPTYTAKQGFKGDEVSAHIKYGWNPSSDGGGLYTINDAGYIVYITEKLTKNGIADFGATSVPDGIFVNARRASDNSLVISIHGAGSLAGSTTEAQSEGLFICRRKSSTNVDVLRGADVILNDTQGSTAIVNLELFGLCVNSGSGGSSFSGRRIGCMIPYKQSLVSSSDIKTMWDEHMARIALL